MHRVTIPVLVVIHLVAIAWHGEAHIALAIDLPAAKDLFVYTVILGLPILAAILVQTKRFRVFGVAVFSGAMFASFLFAGYHHYVLISPDHIAHLPTGSANVTQSFLDSAAVIGFLDASFSVYGAFAVGRLTAIDRG